MTDTQRQSPCVLGALYHTTEDNSNEERGRGEGAPGGPSDQPMYAHREALFMKYLLRQDSV